MSCSSSSPTAESRARGGREPAAETRKGRLRRKSLQTGVDIAASPGASLP
jgi:hypothetical protein